MTALAVALAMMGAGYFQAPALPVLLALGAATITRWSARIAGLRAERAEPLGSKMITYLAVTVLFEFGLGFAAFLAGRWIARVAGG